MVAGLSVGGCSYQYRNPAEVLRSGEVQGRTVSERGGAAGAFDPVAGVAVALRNSAPAAVSRATGFFTYLDLPAGRHQLLLRKGVDQYATRDVEVALGADGQPQGVLLGDVVLQYTVAVGGRVRAEGGEQIQSCLAVDDATGLTAPNSGGRDQFEFIGLALGEHRLRYSATVLDAANNPVVLVGGPQIFTLTESDQRTTKELAPFTLRPVSGATGHLRFRIGVIGAALGLGATAVSVTVSDVSFGAAKAVANPLPASDGLVDLEVPEGPYTVALALPVTPLRRVGASAGGGGAGVGGGGGGTSAGGGGGGGRVQGLAPPEVQAVVLAGESTDLGFVYVVASDSADQSALACTSDADCQPSGTCQVTSAGSSTCVGWSPPPAVTPGTPACSTAGTCQTSPTANYNPRCGDAFGLYCLAAPGSAEGLCTVCQTCTPDGQTLLVPLTVNCIVP